MPTTKYIARSGPSKFDMMESLLSGDTAHRRTVAFRILTCQGETVLETLKTYSAIISSIERRGPTDDNWLIRMTISELDNSDTNFYTNTKFVIGNYSTKTRSGSFCDYTPEYEHDDYRHGDNALYETIREQIKEKEAILTNFTKLVRDYANMISSNYCSRMGDEDDRRPLERQIVKEFKNSPPQLRTDLAYILLRVVASPCKVHNDGDASTRLSAWFQKLAFERLSEMEEACQIIT